MSLSITIPHILAVVGVLVLVGIPFAFYKAMQAQGKMEDDLVKYLISLEEKKQG